MLSLQKISKYLFLLGLFFIPFNSFEGVDSLGEFRNESAAYFFIIGFLLMLIIAVIRKQLYLPYMNILFQMLILFIAWCFLATVFNIPTVVENYFKHTGGINRFIRQYFSLIISSIFLFLFYWSVIRRMEAKQILLVVRKVFLLSLGFVSVYAVFEILISIFDRTEFISVLRLFNYFPFLEVVLHQDRISSVSYEPPFFAIYLITIAGWMFSYILTSSGVKRFLPMLLILILTFFSGSRTALVVVSFQLLIFFFFLLLHNKFRKYILLFLGGSIIVLTVLFTFNSEKVMAAVIEKMDSLNFKENLTESVSNKSRLGIQVASLHVVKQHPIIGVGFGQQAYHNRFHYPHWATHNNYEFDLMYKNQDVLSFPPGYNIYIRILTETGIVGLSILLCLIISIFYIVYKLYMKTTAESKVLSLVLFISFSGMCLNWLQIDTFRLYSFWICLGILIRMMDIYGRETCKNPS